MLGLPATLNARTHVGTLTSRSALALRRDADVAPPALSFRRYAFHMISSFVGGNSTTWAKHRARDEALRRAGLMAVKSPGESDANTTSRHRAERASSMLKRLPMLLRRSCMPHSRVILRIDPPSRVQLEYISPTC
jgi:hypothetical protein